MADVDFASLEYDDYAIEDLRYNLDNAIHPVFSAKNFVSMRNFENTDYEVLRPSLRLASLLLEEPSLLAFWHAMFFGVETEIVDPGLEEKYGTKMFSYRRMDGELTAEDIVDTHEMLLELAKIVRFVRVESQALEPAGALCTAAQCRMPGKLTGCGARILYGNNCYQGLHRLETSEESHDSIFTARLDFAATMLHELAHAAQRAILGRRSYEHFFENDVVAEAGFAWENFVFGGTLSRASLPTLEEFAIREAPHRHSGYEIDTDVLELPPERGVVSTVEVHWPVRDEFVRRLFTKRFWAHTVKKQGAAAFRFPKDDGFLVRDNCVIPILPEEYPPEGFTLLLQGYEYLHGRMQKTLVISQRSYCPDDCESGWCCKKPEWTKLRGSWESSNASGESRRSSETAATSVCSDLSRLILEPDGDLEKW